MLYKMAQENVHNFKHTVTKFFRQSDKYYTNTTFFDINRIRIIPN
jgi:hypothetical protein